MIRAEKSQDRPAAGDQSRSFRSTEVNVRFRRKPPINEADEALWILTGLALGRFHAMQLVIDGAIGAGWPPPTTDRISKMLKYSD
jgi:hypothetical protein